MGLSIHWELRMGPEATVRDVRGAVEVLRERARDLPFERVSDVIDLEGEAADFDRLDGDDPLRGFLVQAQWPVGLFEGDGEDEDADDRIREIRADNFTFLTPRRVMGVSLWAGAGCEPTDLMLCQYPDAPGWRGRGATKTQYASNPAVGGVGAFLRCHLSIIAVLDKAKELGILAYAVDDGGFWESRDVRVLCADVRRWNELMAGFGMLLKGALPPGAKIDAAISAFPDLEHLEAAGAKKLANLAEHFGDLFEE